MPSLKDIRRRIGSVKNTQQVTRAMKMVSAAKLRRAQEAILAARPYAQRLEAVLGSVASRVGADVHPLLAEREIRRVLLVVVTSDRGLCGGFNANVVKRAGQFLGEDAAKAGYESVELAFIGKKGRDAFKRRKDLTVRHFFKDALAPLSADGVRQVAEALVGDFGAQEGGDRPGVDGIFCVYNAFKSAGSQELRLRRLLPVDTSAFRAAAGAAIEHIYEPDRTTLMDALVPRFVANQVHTMLLDSVAAEHAARMVAMEGATKNASEMIDKLTLAANRARQAAITKELLEIVAGAEAL